MDLINFEMIGCFKDKHKFAGRFSCPVFSIILDGLVREGKRILWGTEE